VKNSYQGINHSIFKACWQNQRHVNNAYAKHSMFKACGWNQSHVNHARDCIYINASRMRLVAMLDPSNGDPFMLTIYPHGLARTHLGQEPLKEITRFVDQEIQNRVQ
jgi:hypothetical protein